MTKTTTSKKTTAEKTFKDAQQNMQKNMQENIQKTVEAAQESVQKTVKEATGNLDNVVEFSKANYEAVVASGTVAVKVAQSVNAEFIESSKKAVEKNIADVKALFSAKTPADFFELQASIFKSRYDEFVAESTRANEVVTTRATEVVEPLKARYEEVAGKYNFPVAG